MMIRLDKGVVRDYATSSQLEWLVANGLGGYSSATVAGSNTRRYHGLLIAALNPPVCRTMLLQKVEETVRLNGVDYRLSVNAYPGTLYPTGHQYLEEFRLDPFPIFRYRLNDVTLDKEIILISGENTVIVQYRLAESPEPIRFIADVLINYRDFHSLTRQSQHNSSLRFDAEMFARWIKIRPEREVPPFHVWSDKADFRSTGYWFRNFVYAQELARGYDYDEDLFSPGQFVIQLNPADSINIVASTIRTPSPDLHAIISQQRDRAATLAGDGQDEFLKCLLLAGDSFLVQRGVGQSCIAGYHWFGDWGRDTMISLPGLTLVPGRFQEAKLILQTFAQNIRYGLIPNYFSETDGTPQYNSLDATLWFFYATRKYYQYTNDLSAIGDLYPVLKASVEYLLRGTIFDIKADTDLLLNAGRGDVQLTWMDAKIEGSPITPRNGKPVEINALWYSSLDTMRGFAEQLGYKDECEKFEGMAERVKTNFAALYWNKETNCLFDRIGYGINDPSLRPNQIIAVALPGSLLPRERQRAVVDAVERQLVTPYGLRTLSPSDPSYVGRYEGDEKSRDLAYHQGSVWPWLLGPFVKAYVRVAADPVSARREAAKFLEPIRNHLSDAGVGFISELFDGDPPHLPRGCIAQAWSVGEILRAYYEDILGKEPEDRLVD